MRRILPLLPALVSLLAALPPALADPALADPALADPALADEVPRIPVGGPCGRAGTLVLERVQAERRSDGQWGYLLHIRNTTARPVTFTLSLRSLGRELARRDNQPYRVGGNALLTVPAGPGPRPVPTAEVAAGLALTCPT